jgi:hypothetical protein
MFHLQGRLDGQRSAILRESTIASMRDTRALTNGKKNNYGIGWLIEERHGLTWFGHGGGQAGVATWLSVFPVRGLHFADDAVVIACEPFGQIGETSLAFEQFHGMAIRRKIRQRIVSRELVSSATAADRHWGDGPCTTIPFA